MKTIKAGSVFIKSEVGHNGFLYPDYNSVHSNEHDTEVSTLSYVTGSSNIVAVSVSSEDQGASTVFFVYKDNLANHS